MSQPSQKHHKIAAQKDFKKERNIRAMNEAQAFIQAKKKISPTETIKNIIQGIPYHEISESLFNDPETLQSALESISSAIEHYDQFYSIDQLKTAINEAIDSKISLFETQELQLNCELWKEAIFSYLSIFKTEIAESLKDFWINIMSSSQKYPSIPQRSFQNLHSKIIEEIEHLKPSNPGFSAEEICIIEDKEGCNGAFCDSLESIEKNACFSNKMECTSRCLCKEETCLNRSISKNRRKYIKDVDVIEMPAFGFDKRTAQIILQIIGKSIDAKRFLNVSMPIAINWAANQINDSFKHILQGIMTEEIFNLNDKYFSKALYNSIEALGEIYGHDIILKEFTIHQKGYGIFCNTSQGIPKNAFLGEYAGQIYSAGEFYEKDLAIQNSKNKIQPANSTNESSNFYTVELERNKNDIKGYSVFFVDPIPRGNWTCKINHSCYPNCEARTVIANGRYTIGLYTIRRIKSLEELTWNYSSCTDQIEEYKNSICLCSKTNCSGYYLINPSKTDICLPLAGKICALLFSSSAKITSDEIQYIEQFNLDKSLMHEIPEWLKCWTYTTLNYITSYIELRKNDALSNLKAKIEAKLSSELEKIDLLKDSLIKELTISLSRARYLLSNIPDSNMPPICILTEIEVLNYLWGDDCNSIKNQLNTLFENDISVKVQNLTKKPINNLNEARTELLKIKDHLKENQSNNWIYKGIADILHLTAYNQLFFRFNAYQSFTSKNIRLKNCELYNFECSEYYEEESNFEYDGEHLHRLLAGWNSRDYAANKSIMFNGLKGPLLLPSIQNSQPSFYNEISRIKFLNKIFEAPLVSWSEYEEANLFIFDEEAKVFGTPMFYDYVNKNISVLNVCFQDLDVQWNLISLST
ncbi:unnamed protein product [Blepharisma stoltei]|uniref:SET domain-containing protein n=1 Tax=Blepharisma stoltei TaxID=1481888 RepID=A0AAU9KM02_9CILI|nr:unnamed protein product [Blepharisma stoltei]